VSNPQGEPVQPQTGTITVTDTKLWKLIAWVLGIIGAVIVLVAGPKNDKSVMHWVRMSIAFFIVAIVAGIIGLVLAFIPILGTIIYYLILLGLIAIWLVGILKILQDEDWNPPIVSGVAEKINVQ